MQSPADQQWLLTEADRIFNDVEAVTKAFRECNEEAEQWDDEDALPQSAVYLLDKFTVEQHLQFVDEVFGAGDCKHREMMLHVLLGSDMEVRIHNNIRSMGLLNHLMAQRAK